MEDKIIETRREYVPAYSKIWNMPIKIHAIEGTKLLIPLSIWDIFFYFIGFLIMFLLNMVFPFIQGLPLLFKYIFIPWFLMKFMLFSGLEGKQPHKYFWDLLVYLALPKNYEYFKVSKYPKKIKFKNQKIYFSVKKRGKENV
jgi:hypothetical protein